MKKIIISMLLASSLTIGSAAVAHAAERTQYSTRTTAQAPRSYATSGSCGSYSLTSGGTYSYGTNCYSTSGVKGRTTAAGCSASGSTCNSGASCYGTSGVKGSTCNSGASCYGTSGVKGSTAAGSSASRADLTSYLSRLQQLRGLYSGSGCYSGSGSTAKGTCADCGDSCTCVSCYLGYGCSTGSCSSGSCSSGSCGTGNTGNWWGNSGSACTPGTPGTPGAGTGTGSGNSSNTGSQTGTYEEQVVTLLNEERAKVGAGPVKINSALSKVAQAKSEDMKLNNYFSHTSPTYGSPFDMMKSFGISYSVAGENIAMGQQSPQAVVTAWMNSQSHRENMLKGSYTEIGIGYVASGNYWTMMLIG